VLFRSEPEGKDVKSDSFDRSDIWPKGKHVSY
jgi:hypothetical protein